MKLAAVINKERYNQYYKPFLIPSLSWMVTVDWLVPIDRAASFGWKVSKLIIKVNASSHSTELSLKIKTVKQAVLVLALFPLAGLKVSCVPLKTK